MANEERFPVNCSTHRRDGVFWEHAGRVVWAFGRFESKVAQRFSSWPRRGGRRRGGAVCAVRLEARADARAQRHAGVLHRPRWCRRLRQCPTPARCHRTHAATPSTRCAWQRAVLATQCRTVQMRRRELRRPCCDMFCERASYNWSTMSAMTVAEVCGRRLAGEDSTIMDDRTGDVRPIDGDRNALHRHNAIRVHATARWSDGAR
jgi:hypothetical protein